MARRVAIVGYEMSKQAAKLDDQRTMIIFDTVRALLEKKGIRREEIDTVVMCSNDFYDGRTISNVFTVEPAAAYAKDETKVEQDGIHALIYAAMRIMAGTHDSALIVAYSKGSEFEPSVALAAQLEPTVDRQYLFLNDVALAAFQARAYMLARGATEDHLAAVAAKNLGHARKNPLVCAREYGVSAQAVKASPMQFDPLRELMKYPITDGCCVMLLAGEEKAKKLADKPVWIQGMGFNQEAYHLGLRDLTRLSSAQAAAKRAYAMAGIKDPGREIRVAEVSELFAHQELMLTEALHLCAEGEGVKNLEAGHSALGGRLPVNPSGGALAACAFCAVGLVRAAEAAMQINGEAGKHQVDGVTRAVAHGQCGPAAQNNAVVVLGRE